MTAQKALLDGILASADDGIFARDPSGRYLAANAAYARLQGWTAGPPIGRRDIDMLPEEQSGRAMRSLTLDQAAMSAEQPTRDEETVTLGGDTRILETTRSPLRDGDGAIIGIVGIARDVTEARRSERTRQVLAREVDHRVRNALMVIQTIVRLAHADSLADFKGTVEERISALAACYRILARRGWGPVPFLDLARAILPTVLETAGTANPDTKLTLSGPGDLMLAPEAAQALGMALHELTTNAVRHGGLSDEAGRVDLSWTANPDGSALLRWTEAGGPPPAAAPRQKGFGSLLLETTLEVQLGATVDFRWQRSGLDLTIILPAGLLLQSTADVPLRAE